MQDVRGIANVFIILAKKEGMTLPNMTIQKLPYIAQGWSLALFDKPLIKDIPQAWGFGPVYPNLYHSLRRHGSNNVFETIRYNDGDVCVDKSERGSIITSNLTEEEMNLILSVWKVYKNHSFLELAEIIAREGTPWRKKLKMSGELSPITNDDMKEYYVNLKKEEEKEAKEAKEKEESKSFWAGRKKVEQKISDQIDIKKSEPKSEIENMFNTITESDNDYDGIRMFFMSSLILTVLFSVIFFLFSCKRITNDYCYT